MSRNVRPGKVIATAAAASSLPYAPGKRTRIGMMTAPASKKSQRADAARRLEQQLRYAGHNEFIAAFEDAKAAHLELKKIYDENLDLEHLRRKRRADVDVQLPDFAMWARVESLLQEANAAIEALTKYDDQAAIDAQLAEIRVKYEAAQAAYERCYRRLSEYCERGLANL